MKLKRGDLVWIPEVVHDRRDGDRLVAFKATQVKILAVFPEGAAFRRPFYCTPDASYGLELFYPTAEDVMSIAYPVVTQDCTEEEKKQMVVVRANKYFEPEKEDDGVIKNQDSDPR